MECAYDADAPCFEFQGLLAAPHRFPHNTRASQFQHCALFVSQQPGRGWSQAAEGALYQLVGKQEGQGQARVCDRSPRRGLRTRATYACLYPGSSYSWVTDKVAPPALALRVPLNPGREREETKQSHKPNTNSCLSVRSQHTHSP